MPSEPLPSDGGVQINDLVTGYMLLQSHPLAL